MKKREKFSVEAIIYSVLIYPIHPDGTEGEVSDESG